MKKKKFVNRLTIIMILVCLITYCNIDKIVYSSDLETGNPDLTNFPLNQIKNIELGFAEELKLELSDREQKNQVRDWLIYSIVTNVELPETQVNRILHDVPIARYNHNQTVHHLEYGEVRSKLLPDNSVIALIPKAKKKRQKDLLAHIADKQRKNLGAVPEKFIVFEYTFDLHSDKATLTRIEDIPGATLFSTEYLYYETVVTDIKELSVFMTNAHDLTFIHQEPTGLRIGGRSLFSRGYKNISVEDIAAIWQSENESPINGTGFSLDPNYDYSGLTKLVSNYKDSIREIIDEIASKEDFFSSIFFKLKANKLIQALDRGKTLEKKHLPVLLKIYDFVRVESGSSNEFIYYFDSYTFQSARYDGRLQGTEVGMILFYTDLLAKLWSMNFKLSTPVEQIPEFANCLNQKLSIVYYPECKKYYTGRLWFGPNWSGFQLSENGSLIFSRNATEIFAAAKDGEASKNEVSACATVSNRINWWNNRYEEIAAYEPQYEALNEIMKWSVAIAWLNNSGSQSLSFLNRASINRTNWFPNWITLHPELKFRQWDKIQFHPKGYKNTETESLPILYSPSYSQFGYPEWRSYGGVSLAKKADLQNLKPISQIFPNKNTIPNVKRSVGNNTFEKTNGTFSKLLKRQVINEVPINAKLRNVTDELAHKPFVKHFINVPGQATFISKNMDVVTGKLKVSSVKNGFRIAFETQIGDKARQLAREISEIINPNNINAILKKREDVENYIILENNRYLLYFKNSNKWLLFETLDLPELKLDQFWDFRTAGFNSFSRTVRGKLLDPIDAMNLAKQYGKKIDEPVEEISNFLDDYAKQSYSGITKKIITSENPEALKNATKEVLAKELKKVDDLLSNHRNIQQCTQLLAKLIEQFGEKPEILFRQALVALNENTPKASEKVANSINKAANRMKFGNEKVLNEINQLINNSSMINEDKNVIKRFFAFRAKKSCDLFIDGPMKIPEGNTVNNYEKIIQQLNKKEAIAYIFDRGINNTSYNVPKQETINRARVSSIERIPKQSLAKYRPEVYVRPQNSFGRQGQPRFGIENIQVPTGSNNWTNCEDEEEGCKEVYYIELK